MGKTRSIRGEVVDFDLLKLKSKMEKTDKPDEVEMREKYIDIKRRRNPRRSVSDLVKEQSRNEQDVREKLRAQKEAKKLQAEQEQETPEATSKPKPTPTGTKRTSRKKIVRKTKEEE